ncbi:MAG: hypothetical protein PHG84_06550 [Endomicrobiaceae bacterium]|nr:hypothetical protein [Endomicrobiaceae bacterium]
MMLILIILSIVCLSLLCEIYKKKFKIILVLSILSVLCFYFFLVNNMYYPQFFTPKSKIVMAVPMFNYYNLLVHSLCQNKLYIATDENYPLLKHTNFKECIIKTENTKYWYLLDTSYYKGKIYMYFGITPILLFYLPYNFLTNTYITDGIVVFICCSLIFLLSLFIIKRLSYRILNEEIPFFIQVLSVFLIGLCNYSLILLVRPSTYEVAIVVGMVLILFSIYFFINYCFNIKYKKDIVICLIAFLSSLAVGCRPHYVFFIPIIFISILAVDIVDNIKKQTKFYHFLLFFVPCMFYGFILGLYNYLRFDSIFEFGFKYQLNDKNLMKWFFEFKELFMGLKYNLFQFPVLHKIFPIFSTVQISDLKIGNEFAIGAIYIFPFILVTLFIPKIIKYFLKINKYISIIFLLISSMFIINLLVVSSIGVVQRFVFEYMSIAVIISLLSFYFIYEQNKKQMKKILNVAFIFIFIFAIYINISLIFDENNSSFYSFSNPNMYNNIVSFLK